MAITNKFPYDEMKKVTVDGSRRYLAPDGSKLLVCISGLKTSSKKTFAVILVAIHIVNRAI